jgi:uncharacterized iron-regulated membrane protein
MGNLRHLSFPSPIIQRCFFLIDRRDKFADSALFWLSQLHFGRFGLFAEIIWGLVGLVPAILAFTGVFVRCRRVFYNKPSNPNTASE